MRESDVAERMPGCLASSPPGTDPAEIFADTVRMLNSHKMLLVAMWVSPDGVTHRHFETPDQLAAAPLPSIYAGSGQ